MGTLVEAETLADVRDGATSGRSSIEHHDRATAAGRHRGGGESGQAGTDDYYVKLVLEHRDLHSSRR
jgi:hypothetical protein